MQPGQTSILDGEDFQIGSETFVFDRAAIGEGVRVSERLTDSRRARHEDLDNFALDPMTWDAPASARPTALLIGCRDSDYPDDFDGIDRIALLDREFGF